MAKLNFFYFVLCATELVILILIMAPESAFFPFFYARQTFCQFLFSTYSLVPFLIFSVVWKIGEKHGAFLRVWLICAHQQPSFYKRQATLSSERAPSPVLARPRRCSRALAGARTPSPAHTRALSVFFAQRWHTFYNYRFMNTVF